MPILEINLVLCDCGCEDAVVWQVLLDGKPLPDGYEFIVNSQHGYVGVNEDNQDKTEVRDEDGNVLSVY